MKIEIAPSTDKQRRMKWDEDKDNFNRSTKVTEMKRRQRSPFQKINEEEWNERKIKTDILTINEKEMKNKIRIEKWN